MSFHSPGETTKETGDLAEYKRLTTSKAESVVGFISRFKERLPKSRAVYVVVSVLIAVGFLVITNFQPDACAVMINGQEAAVVKDRAVAEKIYKEISADYSSEQEVFTDTDVAFEDVRLKDRDLLTEDELRQVFLDKLDFKCKAVAITVDGKAVAWVKDETEAEKAIKRLKNSYCRKDAELLSVKFENELAYQPADVSAGKIMDINAVVSLLKTGADKVVSHTVAEGESLWTIARSNNTHVKDILAANPGMTENSVLPVGDSIKLTKAEPIIHAVAVYKKTVVSTLPFATEYVKDSKLYGGQMKVKQPGETGEKEVVYRFKTKDGVKVGQEKLAAKVLKEPVTKVVARGNKSYISSGTVVASRGAAGTGSGRLKWPTSSSRISRGYSRGHSGLDIDGDTGDPIVAAEAGTVSFAGWSGGYGKCIIVNHGNGLKTRYAHCSSISASVGQSVSRGQVIGRVGSTGNSTGSHLHFEVIIGGSTRNPMNYLR